MRNRAKSLGIQAPLVAVWLLAGATGVPAAEMEPASALPAEQPGPTQGAPSKQPISIALTVSGGVSLGAYQAGYLFYLSETAKLNPSLFKIRLATGASAGMINALLTMMSIGDEAQTDITKTLLYKLWTAMRYDELLDVEEAPPLAD